MIALTVIVCSALCGCPWAIVGMLLPAIYLADTALLWTLYLAVMRLQEVRDAGKMPPEALPFATAVLYLGLFVDCAYNLTWAPLIFLDLPREMLVTRRLERYKYSVGTAAWRRRLTNLFARVLLDPFDPNPAGHVRP